MISQHELGKRFARGDDHIPDASNVSVEDASGADGVDAYVVGYGWAVYAARLDDGRLALFEGWRGYSLSTTCQMTQIRFGFHAALRGTGDAFDDRVTVDDDRQPNTRGSNPDAAELLPEGVPA